jgi:hypothetical protein
MQMGCIRKVPDLNLSLGCDIAIEGFLVSTNRPGKSLDANFKKATNIFTETFDHITFDTAQT